MARARHTALSFRGPLPRVGVHQASHPLNAPLLGEAADWIASPFIGFGDYCNPLDLVKLLGGLTDDTLKHQFHPHYLKIETDRRDTARVVMIYGNHRTNKTLWGPILGLSLAEANRERLTTSGLLAARTNDPETPVYECETILKNASLNFKTMIIVDNMTAAVTLKQYLNETVPALSVVVYSTPVGGLPGTQTSPFNMRSQDVSVEIANPTQVAHTMIVDPHTALALFLGKKTVHIGTVIVESLDVRTASSSVHYPLANILLKILEKDEVGRVIFISDGNFLTRHYLQESILTLASNDTRFVEKLNVTDETGMGPPDAKGQPPGVVVDHPNIARCVFDTRQGEDLTARERRELEEFLGFMNRGDLTCLHGAMMKYMAYFGLPNWHPSKFVLHERRYPDHYAPEEAIESDIPNEENCGIMLEQALKAALYLNIKEYDEVKIRMENERDRSKPPKILDSSIPDILVIVASIDAVASIGRKVAEWPEFYESNRVKSHDTRIMELTKLTLVWKYEPNAGAPSKKKINSRSNAIQQTDRGRIIIATYETAALLELGKNLRVVVMSNYFVNPGHYQSHGLVAPVSEFADRAMILQAESRLGRCKEHENVRHAFFFAGSSTQLARALASDMDLSKSGRSLTLNHYLFTADPEKCGMLLLGEWNDGANMQPKLSKMGKDAILMGMCTEQNINGNNQPVLTAETKALLTVFPRIDVRLSRFLVMATKLGLGMNALALVAYESILGRVSQQASHVRIAPYSCPTIDVYKKAVNYMPMSAGSARIPPTRSEAVAISELWSGLLHKYWSPQSHQYNLMDFVSFKRSDEKWKNLPNENFWNGSWSRTLNAASRPEFDYIKKIANEDLADTPVAYRGQISFPALYKALVKDEGREAFFVECQNLNWGLVNLGIIKPEDITKGIASRDYNRYTVSDKSHILTRDGQDLFEALLCMCLTNVGEEVVVEEDEKEEDGDGDTEMMDTTAGPSDPSTRPSRDRSNRHSTRSASKSVTRSAMSETSPTRTAVSRSLKSPTRTARSRSRPVRSVSRVNPESRALVPTASSALVAASTTSVDEAFPYPSLYRVSGRDVKGGPSFADVYVQGFSCMESNSKYVMYAPSDKVCPKGFTDPNTAREHKSKRFHALVLKCTAGQIAVLANIFCSDVTATHGPAEGITILEVPLTGAPSGRSITFEINEEDMDEGEKHSKKILDIRQYLATLLNRTLTDTDHSADNQIYIEEIGNVLKNLWNHLK